MTHEMGRGGGAESPAAADAMAVEIAEQSDVWARLLARRDEVAALARDVAPRRLRRVVFAGCGDCHAAAEYAEALLELRSALEVRGLAAMEVSRARRYLLGPGTLLVALSVSGRTPRVLEALEVGRRRGAAVLAVSDDPAGTLAQMGLPCLVLGAAPAEALGRTDYRDPEAARYAGYQRPVAQTKTFGAMQLGLALLCLALERLRPSGRGAPRAVVRDQLDGLPDLAANAARAGEEGAGELGRGAQRGGRVTVCGSGLNAGTARFAAYKFLELTIEAAAADIEEFCHTRYLVTGPGDGVVFLAHDRATLERVAEIVPVVRDEVGGSTVVLRTAVPGQTRVPGALELPLALPEVSPLLLGHAAAQLVRLVGRGWGIDTGRFRAGLDEERYVRGSTRMIRDSRMLVDGGPE